MTITTDGDRNPTNVIDRANTALEAWREHGNWDKAAEVAGYTNRGSAYRAAMKLLSRRTDATIAELRKEANERHAQKIAMLEGVIYDLDATLGDRLRAVAEHTRAEARHARFNGLDAPMQVQVSSGAVNRLQDVLADATATVMGLVTESRDLPADDGQEES